MCEPFDGEDDAGKLVRGGLPAVAMAVPLAFVIWRKIGQPEQLVRLGPVLARAQPGLAVVDGSDKIDADEIVVENSTIYVLPLFPSISEMFAADRTFSILLRPDNYIGYIGNGVDQAAIRDYLSRILEKAQTATEVTGS